MNKNNIFINFSFFFFLFTATLHANEKVTLQLSWLHQFQFAGFYIAKEQGFYKDIGLDVEIKEFTYDLNRATYSKEKVADFAIGRSSLLIDKANGEDIVALGAIYQESPLMLLVTKKSGINTINDLKNKKIMITDDAKDAVAITAMLNSNGLNLHNLQIQNHSFDFDDLITHKTDAMASYISNEPIQLENKNIEYTMFHPKDYGFNFYGDILYTSSQYINNNPKVVKDFFEASLKGWEYAFNNTNKTVELIYKKYNSQNKTKSDLLKEANILKKLLYDKTDNQIGGLDKDRLQLIVDVYKILGFIHQDIDLDSFIYEFNPHQTYSFKLLKSEIIYLFMLIVFIIVILTVSVILYSIKSKLLVTNSQLKTEVQNSKLELEKSYQSLCKVTERYKALFHSNMAIELIIDLKTQIIVDSNRSAENFYGYDREQLHTMKISEINILSNEEINTEIKLAKEKKRKVFHFKHKLANGMIKDVEVYSAPIELEGKNYLYSIIFDISDRIVLEKEQNLLQERLSYAIEGSNDGLWDWNIQTHEIYFSPRWKEILGYKDEEVENNFSDFEDKIHPDDIEDAFFEFERFLISTDLKDHYNHNFRMKHKDGHWVPILSRAKKVFDKNNQVERLVGTHVDMTEQQVLKQELEKSLKKLEKLTENVPGAIYQFKLNPDGSSDFPYLSNNIKDLYGVSAEDVLQDANLMFQNLHPDDVAIMKDSIKESAETMKEWNTKYRIILSQQGTRWVHGKSQPEKLEDGSILWTGILNDITEQKEKEILLFEQTKLASMGEMIGNIAHQWRQPLSVISTASTGIIAQKELDLLDETKLIETCNMINENAQYLSKTIDDFKNFIKGDRVKKFFSLEDEINSFLHLVNSSSKTHNIKIILDLQKDIKINGYENELSQCLINIFNNARDALEETATSKNEKIVFISTFIENTEAIIKIKDNAGGIPAKVLPKIFEPYFTTKHRKQGTGLGLHMTYNLIVESMKGSIEATNVSFKYDEKNYIGAEFIIKIPLN